MSDYEDLALEMIRNMLRWTARGRLDWEVSPATLMLDRYGDVAWSVRPEVGGPIVITHRVFSLHDADLEQLAVVATALRDCGEEVELCSRERADYEQEMRRTTKSFLRRKAAEGIRLVSVVSQPIPTDYYQNIGVIVTLAWETESCGAKGATFEAEDVDELKYVLEEQIEAYNGANRLAA